MSDIPTFSDNGALPAVDWNAARAIAGNVTGNRQHDRRLLIETMHRCNVTVVDIVRSIYEGLNSPNQIVSAKAREDWFKIVGSYAPQQIEAEINKYDAMSYDEIQIKLIEDLEANGAIAAGSADAYRATLVGKVRVGALLVDAPKVE